MKIGLVGKPNVGKSTLFAAATLAQAQIGNYPFTTIDPNRGMAALRVQDPGPDLGVESSPRAGKVVDGTRYVPIEVVDVAGLVPGAHEGRGLGNKFLNDLVQADALIHVVDASGATDAEGNPVDAGSHDPLQDVAFLEEELDAWVLGLLSDGWERVARRIQQENRRMDHAIAERLSGLGITVEHANKALASTGLQGMAPSDFPGDGLARLAAALRRESKPVVVALNKADTVDSQRIAALQDGIDAVAIPVGAQSELALAKAAQTGMIQYHSGDGDFQVVGDLSDAQQTGLEYIREHLLAPHGSTGITRVLEAAAFDCLGLVPVFPVEDESHYTDKDGLVLPDCHLVPRGTTAREVAYRVHTDLGDHFVRAIDCRSKRAIAADHQVGAGDVIKIAAKS